MSEMNIRRSQIKPGTATKLIGNDSNGKLTELNYVLNANADWTNANDTTNLRFVSQYAIKQYVDSHAGGTTIDWQESVIAIADYTTINAIDPKTAGDRYLCDTVNTGEEQYLNRILTWSGSAWVLTDPNIGMMTYDHDTGNFWLYDGSAWVEKTFGAEYYGGAGITRTNNTFDLALTTDGGLQFTGAGDDRTVGVKVSSLFKLDTNGIGLQNGSNDVLETLFWDGSAWSFANIINIVGECILVNLSPTETPNGSLKVFTFPSAISFSSINAVSVYINGIRQQYTTHYSITSSQQITFVDAPLTDDIITVDAIGSKI